MMVGHAMLAFALVATAARAFGWDPRRALGVGVVAGVFATLPDVDMVYALSGLAAVDPGLVVANGVAGLFLVTDSFWGASTVVHRSATHSVVLALPIAVAVFLWATDRSLARPLAVGILTTVTVASWLAGGPVDGTVVAVFCAMAVAVAWTVSRTTSLSGRAIALAALLGVGSHPFGDLFTGQPPRLLFPFQTTILTERVALAADPTLHLLGAFGLELATIWLALVVYLWLTGSEAVPAAAELAERSRTRFGDRFPTRFVDRRATLAAGYGVTALIIRPPTLDVSYHFVFSILAVGLILAMPALGWPSGKRVRAAVRRRTVDPETPLSLVLTGLTAVTIGWAAYLAGYLLL